MNVDNSCVVRFVVYFVNGIWGILLDGLWECKMIVKVCFELLEL